MEYNRLIFGIGSAISLIGNSAMIWNFLRYRRQTFGPKNVYAIMIGCGSGAALFVALFYPF